MKNSNLIVIHLLTFLLLTVSSCSGQGKSFTPDCNLADSDRQVAEYIVEIFEDSDGNLWFGTMSKGVARYDGDSLRYFTTGDGMSGNAVVTVVEDKAGNLWFGTHSGLSKYDGREFTNFTVEEGLCHNRVSNILIDRNGMMWVGTWGGVCRFNGESFSNFPIPYPEVDGLLNDDTKNWITELMEDKEGNIWFGRDGYGACKYDGKKFEHFTTKEGLQSNNVQAIHEDAQGNIWFGSRVAENDLPDSSKRHGKGGLNRFDGVQMTDFPGVEGFSENDVYTLYGDRSGNIWISAIGFGFYRYDGENFKRFEDYDRADSMGSLPVQSALEDKNGKLWIGCSGGLFRLQGEKLVNVTQNGPWLL